MIPNFILWKRWQYRPSSCVSDNKWLSFDQLLEASSSRAKLPLPRCYPLSDEMANVAL